MDGDNLKPGLLGRIAETIAPRKVMEYRASRARLETQRAITSQRGIRRQVQRQEMADIKRHVVRVRRMQEEVRSASRTLTDYGARGYDAARMNGTVPGSAYSSANGQDEVMSALIPARQLVREIMRNEAFGQKSLELYVNGICGKGIQPRFSLGRHQRRLLASGQEITPKTLQPMIELYERVMRRWYEWAESTLIDVEGELNLYAMQRLAYRQRGETGEFMIVIEQMTATEIKRAAPGTVVIPYKLRIIETDWLDVLKKETPYRNTTRRVVAGRELDEAGKCVGYWVLRSDPSRTGGVGESYRIDAKNVIFRYKKLRPGQYRGISPYAAVIGSIFDLNDMVQAALETAAARSGTMVFLGVEDGSTEEDTEVGHARARGWDMEDIANENFDYAGETGEDNVPAHAATDLDPNGLPVDPTGSPVRSISRGGAVHRLRKGTDIKVVDPAPVNGTEAFVRLALRKIAAGPFVNASHLSGDFAGKNYSTGRQEQAPIDMMNEIDQEEDIACAWSRVWEIFVQGGYQMEALGYEGYWNLDEVQVRDVIWIKPPKLDFDEERTAEAQGRRLGIGKDTFAAMIAKDGADLIEHIAAMAYERAVAGAYNVNLEDHIFAIVRNGGKAMAQEAETETPQPGVQE